MNMMNVTGNFLSPDGAPLNGKVWLTPSAPIIRAEGATYLADTVVLEVIDGKVSGSVIAPGEGISPSGWTYKAKFALKDNDGHSVVMQGFSFTAIAGDIDLGSVAPVPDSYGEYIVTGPAGPIGHPGMPGRDGADGAGIYPGEGAPVSTYPNGSMYLDTLSGDIYQIFDDNASKLGNISGVGISSVKIENGKFVFTMTNGTVTRLDVPKA